MESFGRDDLISGFSAAGLRPKDVVLLQSDVSGLGKPDERLKSATELCAMIVDALRAVIGPEGTIVIPTFSTQVGRQNLPFEAAKTPSNYGLLANYAVTAPGFRRSDHPLVSVAAIGPATDQICGATGASGFGARSPFDRMISLEAKNVFLGIDVKGAGTIVHYIEMHYGVPYYYNKILPQRPRKGGRVDSRDRLMCVRYLDGDVRHELTRYQKDLKASGVLREVGVGGGTISAATLRDMVEIGYDGLDQDPWYFLDHRPALNYGAVPFDGPLVACRQDKEDADRQRWIRIRAEAPILMALVDAIEDKAPASVRRSLRDVILGHSVHSLGIAEDLMRLQQAAGKARGITPERTAAAYVRFCEDCIREQMEFRRTGQYSQSDYDVAQAEIYDDPSVMEYYMDGLMVSQVLWANHWQMLQFARNEFFVPFCPDSEHHVEIGPGHGYFTWTAFAFGARRISAFDVSAKSLDLTRAVLESQEIGDDRYSLNHGDVQRAIPLETNSATTVMAGEILEHIADPMAFLKEIHRILRPGGVAYVTTAANAPAIDHLFLFTSTDHIREVIRAAAFEIERELPIEVGHIGDKPVINYAAVLRAEKK